MTRFRLAQSELGICCTRRLEGAQAQRLTLAGAIDEGQVLVRCSQISGLAQAHLHGRLQIQLGLLVLCRLICLQALRQNRLRCGHDGWGRCGRRCGCRRCDGWRRRRCRLWCGVVGRATSQAGYQGGADQCTRRAKRGKCHGSLLWLSKLMLNGMGLTRSHIEHFLVGLGIAIADDDGVFAGRQV